MRHVHPPDRAALTMVPISAEVAADGFRPAGVASATGRSRSTPATSTNETSGGSSPNQGRNVTYEPRAYERLRRVKRAHDPANLFRINHNIPPLR